MEKRELKKNSSSKVGIDSYFPVFIAFPPQRTSLKTRSDAKYTRPRMHGALIRHSLSRER